MPDKNVVEILKGLQQAVANSNDGEGSYTEDGKRHEIGLRREEGSFLSKENRLIDGFNIKLQDNKVILNYHSEILSKEAHENGFENNIAKTMEDVVKWLKKEYKKVTGESIQLKIKGKPIIRVESTSRIRSWVLAQCTCEIGGMKSTKEKPRTVDKAIRDWLSQGKGKDDMK